MKKKFSKVWKKSKQARKQRKYRYNAPLHIRHKFMSCNLSKELRQKYKRRNFLLRRGDVVLVRKGEFKKKKAKVADVDLIKTRVFLEGIQKTKKEGTKFFVSFRPWDLQIVELDLEDKKRIKALERNIKQQEIKKTKIEKEEIIKIEREKTKQEAREKK